MKTESLTILVAQARSFLDRQWEAFESQDKKIAGLFGLATALITLIPAIVTAFGPRDIGLRVIPFACSALAYLAAVILLWQAYRPSDVRLIGDATTYSEEWVELEVADVLRLTLVDLSSAQAENAGALELKKAQLDRAAVCVAIQVSFLVAAILTIAS